MSEIKNEDVTPDENKGGDTAELTAEQITELQAKASKAEELEQSVGSLKRDLKKANKVIEETKNTIDPKETPDETPQPKEPDYARLAFLNSQDVKHPDDQKIVMDEAKRLDLPLSDVLAMEHVQGKLKDSSDTRASQDGMPKGSGRKGGAQKGDVDYYIQNPEETTDDLEMANKVIDAKMKKETDANMFSKELHN